MPVARDDDVAGKLKKGSLKRRREKRCTASVRGEEEEEGTVVLLSAKKKAPPRLLLSEDACMPSLEAVVASPPIEGSRGSGVEASATMAENATQRHIGGGGGGGGSRDTD